ncbi:HPP family protein [Desertibacillus haloalkaliphilus]|uniref:HPP family protein n=1 Tax=Desertibacillus haloalkaliphilus TaxID=1328930 RepID=UPI001C2628F9|nr:HPP family protein [Desertibacillus haloalkaliphilus]MBU8908672.1 HPP family protein [Desertibacillus haloalkaliphilus]
MLGKSFNKDDSQPVHTLDSSYFEKMRGNQKSESRIALTDNIIATTGGLIAIIVLSFIAIPLGYPMVLGPMGASALLVFVAYAGPFSQPRHIFGGHLLSTLTALAVWDLFGRTHITIGITLALVLFLMIFAKVLHPPAAASAIVAINTEVGWGFLVTTMICALVLIAISVVYNNFFKDRQYPKQWI